MENCDDGVTDTSSVTEYEASKSVGSCCTTDTEGTDDETGLEVTKVSACQEAEVIPVSTNECVTTKVFPHIFAVRHYDPLLTHGGITNTRIGTGFDAAIKKVVGTKVSSTQVDRVDTDKVTSLSDRMPLGTVRTDCVGGAADKIDGSADKTMCTDSAMQVEQSEVMSKEPARKRSWRCSWRATPLVSCDMSAMCIPPDILPATVKAGYRRGENKSRMPLVVDDSAVFF